MPTRRIAALAFLILGAVSISAPADQSAAAQLQDLKLDDQESQAAWNMFWYEACEGALPGFARMSAPVYKGWRERNRDVIARLEAIPDFRPAMERSLSARVGRGTPGDRASMAQRCTMMMVMVWEPPPVLGKTPAETWNGLMEALRAGDESRALGYFLIQFRFSAGPRLAQLGPEGMKAIAGRIKGFQLEEEKQGAAVARVTTADNREENVRFDLYTGDGKSDSATGWLIERLDELWADCGKTARVPGTGECAPASGVTR